MNNKPFRGLQGAKHRSSSSTFISLHFNKADEDQLEISYRDEKKSLGDCKDELKESLQSNSTFFPSDSKSFTNTELEDPENSNKDYINSKDDKENSSKDSFIKDYWARVSRKTSSFDSAENRLEEILKGKFTKTVEGIKNDDYFKTGNSKNRLSLSTAASEINNIDNEINVEDSNVTDSVNDISDDSILKLSPAIDVAELEDGHSFSSYVSNELSKAKCEILDYKTQGSSLSVATSQPDTFIKQEFDNSASQAKKESEPIDHVTNVDNKLFNNVYAGTFCNIFKESKDFVNMARNKVKFHILFAVIACFCAPIPSWLSGFLVGIILTSWITYWLFKPQKNSKDFPNLNVLSRSWQNLESKENFGLYKGWMNELPSFMNYYPDKYHVSCTRSLYVRLDGSYLRFSYPPKNIPKRAMFNESRHDMQFICQQHYDISGAIVELLPKGLANKRLWSKKYPICLRIPNSKDAVLSSATKKDTLDGSSASKTTNKKEIFNKKFPPRINENNEVVIYLFSRTDRDKHLWYTRFLKASSPKILRAHSPVLSSGILESDSTLESKRTISLDFTSLQLNSALDIEHCASKGSDELDSFVEVSMSKQQKFELYMSQLLTPLHSDHPFTVPVLKKDRKEDIKVSKASPSHVNLTWLNVLIGRLFFDFLIEDAWAQLVTEKIQKKLNKIKLPLFLTELIVKDINLGSALPKIHHASDPFVDERGLWIDIDLSYNGSFHMTLETKLNLLRFKSDSAEFWSSLSEDSKEKELEELPSKSSAFNSDEEDSAESSSDEDVQFPEVKIDGSLDEVSQLSTSGSTGKKILKFVDRVAQSPYFQHATKNKYIKKAIEDISNTPLLLTVEVQWLTGTLALNIPPMPSDRLWYGFRNNPSLSIIARPKLGQHVVTLTHVTEWIEKKLVSEFQKVLVMPNMDDLIIPIMQANPDCFAECVSKLS